MKAKENEINNRSWCPFCGDEFDDIIDCACHIVDDHPDDVQFWSFPDDTPDELLDAIDMIWDER